MQRQPLRQLDNQGNLKCAKCGKISNFTAYGLDRQGNIVPLCYQCFEESGEDQ